MDSMFREDFTKFREMVIADRAQALADRVLSEAAQNTKLLTNPALAISATKPQAAHAAFLYMIAGTIYVKAAGDVPVFSGDDTTTTEMLIWTLQINAAGVITWTRGTDGAAIANVVPAAVTAATCLMGYVLVTGDAAFTPGTDDLDNAATPAVTTLFLSAVSSGLVEDTAAALGAVPNMTSY